LELQWKRKFCRKIFRTYGTQWLAISVVLILSARKRSDLRVAKNTRMDTVRDGYRSEDWIDFYRESAKERTRTKKKKKNFGGKS
jgi:hypothetical protein